MNTDTAKPTPSAKAPSASKPLSPEEADYVKRLVGLRSSAEGADDMVSSMRRRASSNDRFDRSSRERAMNEFFAWIQKLGFNPNDPGSIAEFTALMDKNGLTQQVSRLLDYADPSGSFSLESALPPRQDGADLSDLLMPQEEPGMEELMEAGGEGAPQEE